MRQCDCHIRSQGRQHERIKHRLMAPEMTSQWYAMLFWIPLA